MAKKVEDQDILKDTTKSVLMGTGHVNQQSMEKILEEVINKVVEDAEEKQKASQVLKTEAEHRGKKEVSTSSHGGQVGFSFCNLVVKYQISHKFETCEIYDN